MRTKDKGTPESAQNVKTREELIAKLATATSLNPDIIAASGLETRALAGLVDRENDNKDWLVRMSVYPLSLLSLSALFASVASPDIRQYAGIGLVATLLTASFCAAKIKTDASHDIKEAALKRLVELDAKDRANAPAPQQ